MKRLALDTDILTDSSSSTTFEELHHTLSLTLPHTRDVETPIATFAPIHYESKYSYPLLIWLHGDASNEHELRHVVPRVSIRNYVAVAPRGTWSDPRRRGVYGWRQSVEAIESAESRIADCIAIAQRKFNIHSKRIFVIGHGSGGTMALRVGWNQPHRYAGVVSINGPLPTRLSPLRNVNEVRQIPCFLATSRESQDYPANQVCQNLRLLHSAGCTVALRQYPGGDGLATKMLSDLDRWVMELVCETAQKS